MSNRIVQECLAGGLTALVLIVGYNIWLHARLGGVAVGDWLQFGGAMLGTGLAVLGAVYVEGWKRNRDKKQGQATFLDALNEMSDAFNSAAEPLKNDLSKDVGEINARRYLLEVAKEFADFVLKQHLAPSSKVWRHTRGFVQYIDRILAVSWYVYDEHANDDLCSKESVEHWHKSVTKIVSHVRPIIDREIADARLLSDDSDETSAKAIEVP